MKKIGELINSPITWKQSFIAAVIGMVLSAIYLAVQLGYLNGRFKKTSRSFNKKTKHK